MSKQGHNFEEEMKEQESGGTWPTVYIDPQLIKPSPENAKVYKPVNRNDPEIKAFAKDIAEEGILVPLVISLDNYIISGHRRL